MPWQTNPRKKRRKNPRTARPLRPTTRPAAKKKGKGKLFIVLAVVLVLLGGGGAGAFFMLRKPATARRRGAPWRPRSPTANGIVNFEPFIVNLADPGKRRFLRINVRLLVGEAEEAEHIQESEVLQMRLRSDILELLTEQTSETIVSAEGKAALKKKIAERAHHILETDRGRRCPLLRLRRPVLTRPAGAYGGMLDVPCQVDVIVGRGTITVRDCLKLQRDSIIRLDETAGADLRVEVQGVPTATGEIVVDDETTSVRITEILPPQGRRERLVNGMLVTLRAVLSLAAVLGAAGAVRLGAASAARSGCRDSRRAARSRSRRRRRSAIAASSPSSASKAAGCWSA